MKRKTKKKSRTGVTCESKVYSKTGKVWQVCQGKPVMVDRSEETWNKNRDYQIEVLKRVQG